METWLEDFQSTVASAAGRLHQISESDAAQPRAEDHWSSKQIIGHLIDSAANNLQRFVRLQLSASIDLPGYDGDEWVRVQRYQERPWREIIDLWVMYNTQLASLIRDVNPEALGHIWHTPDGKDLDLEFIMRDYVVHLRHHLRQIESDV